MVELFSILLVLVVWPAWTKKRKEEDAYRKAYALAQEIAARKGKTLW